MLGKIEELLIKEGLKKAEDGDMNFKVEDAIGPYTKLRNKMQTTGSSAQVNRFINWHKKVSSLHSDCMKQGWPKGFFMKRLVEKTHALNS